MGAGGEVFEIVFGGLFDFYFESRDFLLSKAGAGLGDGFGVGEIGFNVVDGSTINQIDATEFEDGTIGRGGVDAFECDEGEAESVGAEGRAAGKDADAFVAAEAGWAHGGFPTIIDCFVESKNEPEVGETFEAPDRIRIAVRRMKHQLTPRARAEAGLARGGKLAPEAGADRGDRLDVHANG